MICRTTLIFVSITLIFSALSLAQSPEFAWASPRSIALGGISTTGFDEPSAMHLNPAALVDIERFTLNAGTGVRIVNGTYSDASESADSEQNIMPFPSISAATNLGSRLAAVGLSLNTFDYTHLEYPAGSSNRYQGNEMLLYSGGLDAALAFMPIRNWSVGFKVGYMAAHAEWTRQLNPFPDTPQRNLDMQWKLDMDATADWSALFGVIWSPNYRFEAGLTYRPPMAYHFQPDISVTLPDVMGGETISSEAKDLRMEIPQEIRLGFHWLASERIDLYLDAGWTNWASLDTLEITTIDPKENIIDSKYTYQIDLDDVWHGHLGVEYLTSSLLTLRFGAFYYSDASNSELDTTFSARGEHYGYTTGAGLHLFEWDIDFAVGQTIYPEKEITGTKTPFPQSAKTEFDEIFGSISVRYRF